MKVFLYRLLGLLVAISLVASFDEAMAQGRGNDDGDGNGHGNRPAAGGALSLPISGTVLNSTNQPIGQFGGTVTINRFARDGNNIVAVGIVRGTVVNAAGQVVKSGVQTVNLPVTNITSLSAANMITPGTASPRMTPAVLTDPGVGRLTLTQAQTCGVLHLDLGGNTINLLGFNISTTPVTIDLSGNSAGPLGNLVCQALGLLNNVAGLVGLLNQILSLVTGLLGGLTGGLGGLGG
jgi:hypothetical protein